MKRLLAAELTILHQLDSVRIVLLVLRGVVISLLALGACEDDLVSHRKVSFFCNIVSSIQNRAGKLLCR